MIKIATNTRYTYSVTMCLETIVIVGSCPVCERMLDALLYPKRVIDTGDNMIKKTKLAKVLHGIQGKHMSPSQTARRNRSLRMAF